MTTKECPNCAEEVKEKAKVCIHCGKDIKKSITGNEIVVILKLAIIIPIVLILMYWMYSISKVEQKSFTGKDSFINTV